MQVVLGMGCDRGTSLKTLESAVINAITSVSLDISHITCLATIDKKNDETALLQLAADHNWLMHFYTANQLATVTVPNPSPVVLKYMGTPAVSEAAALLAAKTDLHDLILEKFKFRGDDDKNATVSIARMRDE